MSQPECITFRFLSGNNLGAVLTLSAGEYSLGAGEECDIQLDEAGLDVQVILTIGPEREVSVRLAHGRALLGGNELTSEAVPFPSGAVLALGFSALTHLDAGQTLESVDLSTLGFVSPGASPEESAPESKEELSEEISEAAPVSEAPEKPDGPEAEACGEDKRRWLSLPRSWLTAAGLVVLCLALLSLIAGSALFGRRAQEREALTMAQSYLNEGGYSHVEPFLTEGMLIFKGEVASQEAYSRLIRDLPKLPYAVAFEIEVRDQLLTDLEKACAVYGASVRAVYSGTDADRIWLYGYVQDPYLEAKLIEAVRKELPQKPLEAHFTGAETMQRLLAKHMPQGLKLTLQPDLLKIYYTGDLTLSDRELLKKLEEAVAAEIKAPVVFDSIKNRDRSQIELYSFTNRDLNLATTHEKSENKTEGDVPEALEDTVAFNPQDIVGVTMQPMRFVSMADGCRYFEGSVLPDGSVLKEISVHALTMERQGEIYIHELK